MRLGGRIRFYILFAAVLPLFGLAFAAGEVARSYVAASVARGQVQAAETLAAAVARSLDDLERVLRAQVANFDLETAPDDRRASFLLATYRLFPEISIAVLVDAVGKEVTTAVRQVPTEAPVLPGHETVGPERLAAFRAALPSVPPGELVRGEPYLPPGERSAVLPVAVGWPGDSGLALGVEIALSSALGRLEAAAEGEREVLLLDGKGRVLLRAGRAGTVAPERLQPLLRVASAEVRLDDAVNAATARLPGRDEVVAIAEPMAAAQLAAAAILRPTWYIGAVALVLSLAAGAMLTRSVTGPVFALREAAVAVGEGDLDRRVQIPGQDELADLGASFNRMAESLARDAREIDAKNREIEAFNRELQERVDERTAQLREAQARLVQSGQLAAVAEMSAGLAHELNNPLAGVLGLVQIVASRHAGDADGALLRSAEAEALRCKEILANLQRFTADPADAATALGSGESLALDALLSDVLALVGPAMRARGVEVELEIEPGLAMRGDRVALGRALGQFFGALRGVAVAGSKLRVTGRAMPEATVLEFRVSATATSQDDWRAAGLGSWVARRVFRDYGATAEELPSGEGTARGWRVVIPRAEGA